MYSLNVIWRVYFVYFLSYFIIIIILNSQDIAKIITIKQISNSACLDVPVTLYKIFEEDVHFISLLLGVSLSTVPLFGDRSVRKA